MPVVTLCNSIASFLTFKLPLAATPEEEEELYRLAMLEVADRVIPELNALLDKESPDSPAVLAARQAAVDVVSIAAPGFVRTCSEPVLGAAFLDGLTEQMIDLRLQQQLGPYAVHLKNRMSAVAPAVSAVTTLVHRHGALRLVVGGGIAAAALSALLVSLWPAPVPPQQSRRSPAVTVREPVPASARPAEPVPPVPATVVAGAPLPAQEKTVSAEGQGESPMTTCFRYTDGAGIIHIVDSREKVPPQYRSAAQEVRSKALLPTETPVTLTATGHVLVPVTISFHGRSGTVMLMVDTGATTTTISEEAAGRIGIDASSGKARLSRLADGRTVAGRLLVVEAVTVGPKTLQSTPVTILGHEGGREEHDGLLGMNFLKSFGHRIDFNRRVIIWDN